MGKEGGEERERDRAKGGVFLSVGGREEEKRAEERVHTWQTFFFFTWVCFCLLHSHG